MIQNWLSSSMRKSVVWGPHILEHPPLCYSEPIRCQVANPSVFATNLAIKIDGEIRNPRPLLRKITSAGKKKTFGWYHYVNITMFAANIIVADKIKVMFVGSSIIAGKIIISG